MFYVYSYTNRVNGKVYVGKTGNLEERKRIHLWRTLPYVRKGKIGKEKRRYSFHDAVVEYGIENFEFKILEEVDTEVVALNFERHYIEKLDTKEPNGYNMTGGGSGTYGLVKDVKFITKADFPIYFETHTKKEESGCWMWVGFTDKVGLPTIKYQERKYDTSNEYSVRRLSLELDKQAMPDFRAHIFPSCNVRLCVNPKHLKAGDEERFLSKVDQSGECWIWIGAIDKDGCGKFNTKHHNVKKTLKAHRYSYELVNGKIPDGMMVCRTCENNLCVKPGHLFLATAKDIATHGGRKRKG